MGTFSAPLIIDLSLKLQTGYSIKWVAFFVYCGPYGFSGFNFQPGLFSNICKKEGMCE